jgi:rubrerythrin
MGTKLGQCLSGWRRGSCRAAVFFLLAAALLAAGCGDGGSTGSTKSERAADAEVLNDLLAQELTAIELYRPVLGQLRGEARSVAAQMRGQDQAHVDALTKAIRGAGGETDAEVSELEEPGPKGRKEALTLAYEEENAALSTALGSAGRLQTPAPRALAAALAASHAQHITLLRQLLGTGLAASVPNPFENGEELPPGGGG